MKRGNRLGIKGWTYRHDEMCPLLEKVIWRRSSERTNDCELQHRRQTCLRTISSDIHGM